MGNSMLRFLGGTGDRPPFGTADAGEKMNDFKPTPFSPVLERKPWFAEIGQGLLDMQESIENLIPKCIFRSFPWLLLVWTLAGCAPAGGPFVVNNSGDGGDSSPGDGFCRTGSSLIDCTLRAAIEESNALAGTQTITFNLPAGDETIYVHTKLPHITDNVVIDGTTQPGYDGVSPAVHLDGSGIVFHVEPNANGLFIDRYIAATVKAIQIRHFPRDGIDSVGQLTLDHLEIIANNNFGIDSNILGGEITASINDTTISENGASGMYSNNTHLSLTRVAVTKNKGGLNIDAGSLNLTQCVIADNTNDTMPGGIFFAFGDHLTIADSVIQRNTVTGAGPFAGGIVIWDTTAFLYHTTISENTGPTSGGIYIGSGTVHLIGSTLTKNRGDDAGGVYVSSGSGLTALSVESGTWIGKSGEGNIANIAGEGAKFGGGIYSQSPVHVQDSYVEGNSGAGIQMDIPTIGTDLQILRSHIRNNSRAGLYALNANLTLYDGTVMGNGAGGIKMNGGSLTLFRSTVSNNYMPGAGGGVSAENLTGAEIRDTAISGNVADSVGGGAYFALGGGTNRLSNVTISGNRSGLSGGGLTVAGGSMNLNNVTVARNTAPEWAGLNSEGSITITNSLLAENSGGNCGGAGIISSTGHNLDDGTLCGFASPGDLSGLPANLGPLQDNGGTTSTHALLAGSPALESGDDATCLPADQRGIIRPQGLHCDIGAYEAETPATATPPSVTPALTPTGTPAHVSILFDPVNFSTHLMYTKIGRSCTPKEVTIQVKISPEEQISSVGLFYRLEEKQGTNVTPWSIGYSMTPQGGGWYALTIHSEDFPDLSKLNGELWLAVQFVANGPNDQVLAHSAVYRQVTVGRCMN
jgi:hypothetical protein